MEGRRVVELDVLAREMYCCRCNLPLHLSNTVGERLFGLASVLLIKCDNSACLATTDVHTGKRTPNGSYCINSTVAIGMTHAGMGPSHVNNFLTECNLPPISDTTLRKKEKEFSKTIHDVAMTSCREAQHQEILLSHGKVAASFDGGWQKRGSGWNYNSNTGHATMIGKETGKIMLWDQRSRSCKTCEYHLANQTTIPDHLCSKNWYGSSKAMESDMAVSMAHTLKNDGCEIKVIHADNDSATTSKLKVDFEDLEKRDDQNHLKKGLSKSLHQMSIKYKGLKQDDTREYILRCFMYAITGGTTEDDIKVSLDRIVPHIFGNHDSCREVTWCKYEEDPTNFN
ncbi:uncharacterized protein [Mytilus edulis]|uniref:uncharacterized protein n=1 Tax=Mytilus edulis TaxID=6550 RepID=UPI0039F06E23